MNSLVRTPPAPVDVFGRRDPPHPVDRQVGLRIRMRRKELRISQEKLAEALGLTFQQVQKYERATNRVSASKLFEIARALNTNVSYFYDGLVDPEAAIALDAGPTSAPTEAGLEFLLTPEGPELALLFQKLPRRRLRRKLVELIRVIAEEEPALDVEAADMEDCALTDG
jgi:transcriptional regulator with XRE-family HTH domain